MSMRLGLMAEMSAVVLEKLFSGGFPVYPYMYTLRQFMRMNGVKKQDIEDFVVALAGKRLSVREIEQLAHGYFRGPASFREVIRQGHVALALDWFRQVPEDPDGCNEFERVLLKDLEIAQKYIQRVMGKSEDRRLKTPAFFAQAHLTDRQVNREHLAAATSAEGFAGVERVEQRAHVAADDVYGGIAKQPFRSRIERRDAV